MIAMLTLMLAMAPEQAATQAKPVAEKKVCRRYEETGSRVRATRVCHTASEWVEIDDQQRAASTAMVEQQRLRTISN